MTDRQCIRCSQLLDDIYERESGNGFDVILWCPGCGSIVKLYESPNDRASDSIQDIGCWKIPMRREKVEKGPFLITYRCEQRGHVTWGCDIATSIEDWVAKVQQYEEVYLLVNVQPVSKEFAEKYDGALRGM